MAQDHDKTELIAELARARARLTDSTLALRSDLAFSTRVRKAFKSSPIPWLGGAALAGIIIARLPGRRKKVVKVFPRKDQTLEKAGKAGLLLGAMKIAFDFARPFLLRWATQRFTEHFAPPTEPQYRRR